MLRAAHRRVGTSLKVSHRSFSRTWYLSGERNGLGDSSEVRTTPVTDGAGIPINPTWSVHELLTSYPRPSISPATLEKLHRLSALIPPQQGTKEHEKLTREMEEMVRLVEAVKLVKTEQNGGMGVDDSAKGSDIPDGRIWPSSKGLRLADRSKDGEPEFAKDEVAGKHLLKYAKRTENGFYVVDTERRRQ